MKGKIIAIVVLLIIAAAIVYSMFSGNTTSKSTGSDSGSGTDTDAEPAPPKTVIVTQITWKEGDPVPEGYEVVTLNDGRTGPRKTIRLIGSRG